jgi:hypothetical protein
MIKTAKPEIKFPFDVLQVRCFLTIPSHPHTNPKITTLGVPNNVDCLTAPLVIVGQLGRLAKLTCCLYQYLQIVIDLKPKVRSASAARLWAPAWNALIMEISLKE